MEGIITPQPLITIIRIIRHIIIIMGIIRIITLPIISTKGMPQCIQKWSQVAQITITIPVYANFGLYLPLRGNDSLFYDRRLL